MMTNEITEAAVEQLERRATGMSFPAEMSGEEIERQMRLLSVYAHLLANAVSGLLETGTLDTRAPSASVLCEYTRRLITHLAGLGYAIPRGVSTPDVEMAWFPMETSVWAMAVYNPDGRTAVPVELWSPIEIRDHGFAPYPLGGYSKVVVGVTLDLMSRMHVAGVTHYREVWAPPLSRGGEHQNPPMRW